MKLKNTIENPCDTCHRIERGYAIGKKLDGKIVRYSCYDKCKVVKEFCRKVVEEIKEEKIKNES